MNTGFWQETIAFGKLKVPRFMSAPLDGITDSPFRQLIRDFSPHEMLMTEMRHIALVCHEKTGISLAYNPIEQPLAFQFSGNSTNFLPESDQPERRMSRPGGHQIRFRFGLDGQPATTRNSHEGVCHRHQRTRAIHPKNPCRF
jgi:hypothetical protein